MSVTVGQSVVDYRARYLGEYLDQEGRHGIIHADTQQEIGGVIHNEVVLLQSDNEHIFINVRATSGQGGQCLPLQEGRWGGGPVGEGGARPVGKGRVLRGIRGGNVAGRQK